MGNIFVKVFLSDLWVEDTKRAKVLEIKIKRLDYICI